MLIGHDHYGAVGRRVFGSLPQFFKLAILSHFVSYLPGMFVSVPRRKDSMAVLKELLEAGKLTPIVDRTFPLSAVPEAIAYLQSGNACGKIIITP